MAVMDCFTRYAWTYTLKNKTGQEVLDKLKEWILVHGSPKIFQSDNGKEFAASCMSEYLKSLDVRIIHGRPYYPQSQGKVERINRTLKVKLVKLMLNDGITDWEQELSKATSMYNNQVHSTIKMTPFRAFFGTPKNILDPVNLDDVEAEENVDSIIRNHELRHAEIVANLEKANEIMLRRNAGSVVEYCVDDTVKQYVPGNLRNRPTLPGYIEANVYKVGENYNYRLMYKDGSLSKNCVGPAEIIPCEDYEWEEIGGCDIANAGYVRLSLGEAVNLYDLINE